MLSEFHYMADHPYVAAQGTFIQSWLSYNFLGLAHFNFGKKRGREGAGMRRLGDGEKDGKKEQFFPITDKEKLLWRRRKKLCLLRYLPSSFFSEERIEGGTA